jgi:hypothetical protein
MHSHYLASLLRINFLHGALLPKIQVKAETGKGKLQTGLAGEGLTEMVFPAKQACSHNGLKMDRIFSGAPIIWVKATPASLS